jgi:penicillin-binding protein A
MTPEKRIWILGNIFIGLLALLSFRIVYWQLLRTDLQAGRVNAPVSAAQNPTMLPAAPAGTQDPLTLLKEKSSAQTLQEQPLPLIQRTLNQLDQITRGSIYDRSGRLLAYDVQDSQGARTRWYTEPSLADSIGYLSGTRLGVSGLEAHYNDTLLGLNDPQAQLAQLLHQPQTGSDLILTIDSSVQRAAESALGSHTGAVVALDGQTGAILAMVSAPHFDPNQVQDQNYVKSLLSACQIGNPNCPAPFLNRATQALYPPGSTFKTVTLIADLDSGKIQPDFIFDFGKAVKGPKGIYYVYKVDGGEIQDPNHAESRLNLTMAYARSANAAFARMGNEMGGDTLIDYAQRLGFSNSDPARFPVELDFSPAQLAQNIDELRHNNLLRAVSAIGQGEVLATPLSMARVVLAVLNAGRLPDPYLVETIRDSSGVQISGPDRGKTINGIMSAETAQTVKQMMITAVKSGSGGRASVSGATVGGKTGTAQVGGTAAPHAWFIGFAEQEKKSVVVVVLVENGGEGSLVAAPIFAQVARAALQNMGKPVQEVVPNLPAPQK